MNKFFSSVLIVLSLIFVSCSRIGDPDNNVIDIGGSIPCLHSLKINGIEIDNPYHSVTSSFIEFVGEENFSIWSKRYEDNSEAFNIEHFVYDFNIPRNIFEFIYAYDGGTKYQVDYNIDAIYSNQCDEYYSEANSEERVKTYMEGYYLTCLKSNMLDYVINNNSFKFSDWCNKKNESRDWCKLPVPEEISKEFMTFTGQISRWTISEFIQEFDISVDIMKSFEKRFSNNAQTGCTLDYSKLYFDLDSDIIRDDVYYIIYDYDQTSSTTTSIDISASEVAPLAETALPSSLSEPALDIPNNSGA